MTPPAWPREGTILDAKWRIASLLGEGGMGAVYEAVHLRNGLSVAIKVLSPKVASDESFRKRFLSEGYLANRVGHAGCVQVLDDGTTPEGLPYLVMERLRGRTLEAILEERTRVPINEALRYGLRAAEILSAAHEKGLVHRDVKPENIFLCEDGDIKILDFGIAQVKDGSEGVRITVQGVPLGTPAFMPPEQALAQWNRVGPPSDVYSLGVTLFNLITGELVHRADSVTEYLVRVTTQRARPIRVVAPQTPAALAEVIDRALAYEPENRYASATEMLADLRRVEAMGPFTTLASAGGVASPSTEAAAQASTGPIPLELPRPIERAERETSKPVSSASSKTAPIGSTARALLITAFAIAGVSGGVAMFLVLSQPREAPSVASDRSTSSGVTREVASGAAPASASASRVEPDVTPQPSPTSGAASSKPPVATPVVTPLPPSSASASAKPVASAPKPPTPDKTAAPTPPPTPVDPHDPMGFH